MANQINRRVFVGAALAAVLTGDRDEWLVVAHLKPNLNGRAYTPGALKSMADAAKGTVVADSNVLYLGDDIPLHAVVGVCEEARLTPEGQVQCRFRWCKPPQVGSYITPSGIAFPRDSPDGVMVIDRRYRLTSFALDSSSAFQRATGL